MLAGCERETPDAAVRNREHRRDRVGSSGKVDGERDLVRSCAATGMAKAAHDHSVRAVERTARRMSQEGPMRLAMSACPRRRRLAGSRPADDGR